MYLKLRKMDNAEDEDDASDDSGMLEESEEKRLKRRSSVLSWLMMKVLIAFPFMDQKANP